MSFSQSSISKLSSGVDDTQEKDANSQLMELDKGLGSLKVGEQCESIVRFPRLFEKYPFPILINSAFLKLADVFRVGSNFLRLCILKVTQQSEKHLDKILSVEEFVRRIFSVIHSNDPVARAITLRVLGSCAPAICDRKNVHHSILNGLDSHDSVEREAAIFAADKFAEFSKSFAGSMCNKLADMIERVESPVEMKLKLIPIFQHMHHDAATAVKVQSLCRELLASYPGRGQNFVLVTLHTLTQLSARSLMDIPQQVELLIQYVTEDCRKAVRTLALKDLEILANKGPHMWTKDNIENVCKFVMTTPYVEQKVGGLTVLTMLSGTIAVTYFPTQSQSQVTKLCGELCFHGDLRIAVKATELLTHTAIHQYKNGVQEPLQQDAASALETQLVVATSDSSVMGEKSLKTCLHCVVQQCEACPTLTDHFVDMITCMLATVSEDCAVLLCDCLSSLSSHSNDLLANLVPDILETVQQVAAGSQERRDTHMLSLLTLVFQAHTGEDMSEDTQQKILNLLDTVNAWSGYKVARQAARYGQHKVAACIFRKLTEKVSTEHFYLWLSGLAEASQAEDSLGGSIETVTDFTNKLATAQSHYHKAIAAFKAAALPDKTLQFQCDYLRLRSQMLQAQLQLTKACCSFQTSPPPAIATSLAMTTRQEIHRYGHIVSELQKCGKQFEVVCQGYKQLYQASFDADTATLNNIQLLQQASQVLIFTLDSVLENFTKAKPKRGQGIKFGLGSDTKYVIEHKVMHIICNEMLGVVQETIKAIADVPLTHQHIECIQHVSMSLSQVPLCMPRYFFQSLQTTGIKLAISPQSRNSEPVTIHFDTCLTLKVEGIIHHTSQRTLTREVHAVKLSVSSSPQSISASSPDTKIKEAPNNEMSQSAEPHNDYFSSHFLLTFPITGLYTIVVEAAVEDSNGVVWHTGPTTSLEVKSYDEAVQRKQQQQYASHRQQQRAQAALTQFST